MKKIQNFSKFWGFPLEIRFFGLLHLLKENGCKNRLKVVWTSKIDGYQGKMPKICENCENAKKKLQKNAIFGVLDPKRSKKVFSVAQNP